MALKDYKTELNPVNVNEREDKEDQSIPNHNSVNNKQENVYVVYPSSTINSNEQVDPTDSSRISNANRPKKKGHQITK